MSKPCVSEEDFKNCQTFFSKSLPILVSEVSKSLSNIDLVDTTGQQIDQLGLFLDLIGTECFKEVLCPHISANLTN
ncbi:orf 30 [Ateline gammaherpesvirus 3]|uniref:Orf 30 n=1 Tax=Ateline herpesvirus 3 TaxID=85618 RepID=Q9YTN6_ATHV3|nr:orf 30 [Ateline gammaherpesvirus 3]AAC95556.1 orf 30 [Ateline gammaherpesvirus 3]